jgi:uncharacterized phage protein (TIGR01671 family)
MREIKFRGKRIDNGEWVYGYYWSNDLGNHFIKVTKDENGFCLYDVEVDPATVGQCTGLNDKNGREIYEGDNILWGDKTARGKGTAIRVVVEYKGGCFGVNDGKHFHEFYHYSSTKWDEGEITDDIWGELPIEKYFKACFEVIDNIHDNPELLGGAK